MANLRFIKIGLALIITGAISGCSFLPFFGSTGNDSTSYRNYPDNAQNECIRNRASCMYEGSYEKGERYFAEEEARRLNQASLERLRRMSVK